MVAAMGINNPGLLKKLIGRIDGTADSAKVEFESASGRPWQAELSLHSGTDPQSPRLLVIFRDRTDVGAPQRYKSPTRLLVARRRMRRAESGIR